MLVPILKFKRLLVQSRKKPQCNSLPGEQGCEQNNRKPIDTQDSSGLNSNIKTGSPDLSEFLQIELTMMSS